MDRIGHILPRVLKRRGLLHHAVASSAVEFTQIWITEHLPAVSGDLRAQFLKETVVIIYSDSSIAAQECHLVMEDLTASLRKEYGNSAISGCRIVRSD
ncbi:MAG: hypothetical protein O2904_00590 [bacterium]|nr:hypothetical protein [bacterium]